MTHQKWCIVQQIMIGGNAMITVKNAMFDVLSDENKTTINELIEFLYHKQNNIETNEAIQDALSRNTVGPFNSVDDFFKDLDEED